MAINTARLKLDELLGELSDKFEESTGEDDDELKQAGGDGSMMPPPTTPSKRTTPRTPRKRRRKEITFESDFENASRPRYMVTLFDRAVDLAQFDSETELYEMCRAWMINRPNYPYSQWQGHGSHHAEPAVDGSSSGVHSLLGPVKNEFTGPRPLPPACKMERLEDVIDKGTDIQDLKKENMARWRKVGNRWRDASFRSQERYADSLKQLKALFLQQPG